MKSNEKSSDVLVRSAEDPPTAFDSSNRQEVAELEADSESAASPIVAAPVADGRMAMAMSDRMSEAMTMTRTMGRDICS